MTCKLCLATATLALLPFSAPPAVGGTPALQFTDSCPAPEEGAPAYNMQCAMLEVPLDYRNPNGRKISIAVSRMPAADPSKRRGVLFLNPGGPGGFQALDMPRIFTFLFKGTASQSILDEYDLIGFDPRGENHSTPITCGLTPQQTDQAFPPLMQDHSFDATTAFVTTVAGSCAHYSGPLLPFMTTANTARDMDVIRQGLGETRINYFAWSYGSYLGAVYATLFPDNTDRVVIDSVVDPNWVWRTQFRKWGLGGQTRWPDFANWAAANDATYHFGSTADQVTETYSRLMAAADAHPFTDTNFFDDGTLINGPMFQALTFDFLANDREFALDIAPLWQDTQQHAGASASTPNDTSAADASGAHASAAGNDADDGRGNMNAPAATHVASSAGSTPVLPRDIVVPADNAVMSGMVVLCDDVQWSRVPARYEAELQQDIQRYPLFGAYASNIWECAFWPNALVESPVQITASGPANILMVQNLRDPNTPYPGALEMHTALGQRSRFVAVDHGGHGVFGLEPDSVCAANFITAYLADGVFPAGDEFCAAGTSTAAGAAPTATAKDQVRRALLRQMAGHQGLPR